MRIPGLTKFQRKGSIEVPPGVALYTATSKLAPHHVYDFGSLPHGTRTPTYAFGEIAKSMAIGRDLDGGDCQLDSPPTLTGSSRDFMFYVWSVRCPSRSMVSRITGLVGKDHLFVVAGTAIVGSPSDSGVYDEIVASFIEEG